MPKRIGRFDTPLDIPDHETKNFKVVRIKKEPGEIMPAVSWRTAILEGVPPLNVLFPKGRIVHYLKRKKGDEVMMSDTPQEIYDHEIAVKNAKGHVLVGGLGLGYYPSRIINKKTVKSVTVVEKEKEIIDLIKPYIDSRIKIVHANLYDYLKSGQAKFDYGYMDIWYGTGEFEFIQTVLPLKRLIRGLYGKKKTDYWKENEMIGQFIQGFDYHIQMPQVFEKVTLENFSVCPVKYAVYSKIGIHASPEDIRYWSREFFKDIGSPEWEETWKFKEKIRRKKS